jgi:hypothetical protein
MAEENGVEGERIGLFGFQLAFFSNNLFENAIKRQI